MTRSELLCIKPYVIGLFKIRGFNEIDLVVEDKGDYMDTLTFTPFAVMQESYNVPKSYGTYKRFPDGKNMNQMLEDPQAWVLFLKELGYEI